MSIAEYLKPAAPKSFFTADSKPGDTVSGTVKSVDVRQVTDFKTREPKKWDDGSPMMQIIVVLDTGEVIEPDGVSVYIKTWGQQIKALRTALSAVGAEDLEVGELFTATYVGDEKSKTRGHSPSKVYEYTIG